MVIDEQIVLEQRRKRNGRDDGAAQEAHGPDGGRRRSGHLHLGRAHGRHRTQDEHVHRQRQ